MEERRLIKMSDTAVILTYRAMARKGKVSSSYRTLASSGYVLQNATWKMIFHQQTPLPPRSI